MNARRSVALLCCLAILAIPALAETIRVGSELDFPPYADTDRDSRAVGYSIDLFNAVARVAGLNPSYQVSNWNAAWNGLLEGKLDALPLVARLPEREKLLEFTQVHTYGYDAIFARTGHEPEAALEMLRGKCVL